MVNAEDAIKIYRELEHHGIPIWLTGGWGIDALLGRQTRPHKDLDAILLLDDMLQMSEILGQLGFINKELWSENCWTVDSRGAETATAFFLEDAEGRQFDAHAITLDEHGNGIPSWKDDSELVFKKEDFAGEGTINGISIRCFTPQIQLFLHSGYELPDVQLNDLSLLREKFALD